MNLKTSDLDLADMLDSPVALREFLSQPFASAEEAMRRLEVAKRAALRHALSDVEGDISDFRLLIR